MATAIALAPARSAAAGRPRAARGLMPDPIVLAALVPALLVIALLLQTLWLSVRTDVTGGGFTAQNFVDVFADSLAYSALVNTLVFASVSTVVALCVGVPFAWIVERTDFRAKSTSVAVVTLGILIPGFMTAMGWLFLFHPRSGIANRAWMDWTGSADPLFNVVGVVAMGLVEGIALAPVVFVMAASSLRALDSSLEEAAAASGAGLWQTLTRVTFPLVLPAIVGAGFYVFVIGIAAFDLPAVIGGSNRIYLFATFVALQINPTEGLPNYGVAAAFSAFMIVLGLVVSTLYTRMLKKARRYQTISGKSYRPKLVPLGRAAPAAWVFVIGYMLLAIGLPLAMLIWTSLLPFLEPPSAAAFARVSLANFRDLPWSQLLPSLRTTLILVVAAPAIALFISMMFSWITLRSRSPLRYMFDTVAFLPHAVPNIIFGFAILIATLYFFTWPFDLYGSLAALVVALALNQMSFGSRITNGSVIQISNELEEAAYISGASTQTVLRRIILPLIRPALAYGFLWLGMLTFRELTLSNILSSPENTTLPVAIYSMFKAGQTGESSAASLLLIALLLPFVVLYLTVMRRRSAAVTV